MVALAFKSSLKVNLEKVDQGDLKITFDSPTMNDLLIKKSGIPREQMGGEARQLLAASISECLCSTLISLLEWSRVNVRKFLAQAEVVSGKDEEGRLCVDTININIDVEVSEDKETLKRFERALTLFGRGCLMSRSLKRGIKVNYSVNKHFVR